MKIRSLVAALALAAGVPAAMAAPACTQTFSLGWLSPSSSVMFGDSFSSPGSFNDCFSFSLSGAADAICLTLQWDWSTHLDLDLNSVALSGTGLSGPVVDTTPSTFTFANLQSGSYVLAVAGAVTDRNPGRNRDSVGYSGLLSTNAPSIAAPVPEPETYAMLLLGAGLLGWGARRRKAD